jgi:polyprenyl-phospho-N-acetylgalactosaminyl synthase
MQTNMLTFVVIPSYNEGKVIRHTILGLLGKNYTVVVIDDCSSDDTFSYISDLPIHYIRHPVNLGQGAALQTGMKYAILQDADFVIHFDADGQHNFEEIPHLLQPLLNNECDIVLGSRFLKKEDIESIPTSRRMLLRFATFVNAAFSGLLLSDAHNGFRALSKKAFHSIEFTENRMAHATEILMLIKKHNLRYKEVPVHVVYTEYSKEKGQSSWAAFKILLDLIINKLFNYGH